MSTALASMTGFARAEGSAAGLAWAWELRSVNGRGLDLRFRLPPGWDALEPALREAAGKALKRGNVTANLTVKRESEPRLVADPAALEQALALALDLHARIPGSPVPRAEALLGLPGVLRPAQADEADGRPERPRRCAAGFARALAALVTARQAEGARLAATLAGLLRRDRRAASPGRDRGGRSARGAARAGDGEPAGAAARGAVVARGAHRPGGRAAGRPFRCARGTRSAGEPHRRRRTRCCDEAANIGRRFDFLVQEFNREANTLCSKSASVALTATGLKLKATIEQLREQVQNIE